MSNTLRNGDRPRVLVLADACNPEWHSLPALAYNYICHLTRYVDVVLVTQIRNKPNIDKVGLNNAEIVYLDTEAIAAPIYKLASFVSGDPNKAMTLKVAFDYPSYLAFEWAVWQHFKQDLRQGRFDIVHRVSPMSPTIPSPIASWTPVPFVIGPLLGGLAWPPQFKQEMHREREWMNYLRAMHRLMPFYQATYRRAAAVLAAYDHTISDLPPSASGRIINFSEGGVDPDQFPLPDRHIQEKKTILFVGRLVPFKLPEVVVHSFAASPILRQHKLVIVGDGPERPRLEQMVQEHHLSDCVEFKGTIPQSEVGELMRQSEIFAFPSIREQGGGVLTLAAMSGMACVVVNYGGPASRIPEGCGVRVPLGTLPEIKERFTTELESLVQRPDQILKFGQAARDYTIANYAWDAKAKRTLNIYQAILDQQPENSSFSQPSLVNF